MGLKEASFAWALAHILKYGDTDLFPVPFEYDAIKRLWKDDEGVRTWLLKQDPEKWICRAHRRCLVPKHRFGFRISTQLDPLDTLMYTALVYELGKAIENKRLPAKTRIVHSYRFRPAADGQFYDQQYGWESFRQHSLEEIKSEKYGAVVVADIADFFPRLYSHPLENALGECTVRKKSCAQAVKGLLKQWNQTISYGLPVGPSASRLLSELALTVVDDRLVSDGIRYCRFSDDYRLFCADQREAYERLAMLAQVLFDTLGLTLQQHKTRILSKHEAIELFVTTKRKERARLSQEFRTILIALGISDPYKRIDYAKLSPSVKAQVDALNLEGVLEEQISLDESLDVLLTSFVLNRLAQLENQSAINLVMESLNVLYPVFREVVTYVSKAAINLHANKRKALGAKLLDLLDSGVPGHLEFHRCWILNVFAESDKWDNQSSLAKLKPTGWSESFSRRELILARGRARHESWFKSEKLNVDNLPPWERRAFIYAASCLPGDEPRHWWDGLKRSRKLDTLERAVVAYAKQHPIAG
jgi:hypothetical protein